jgi:hypothetical protein
MFGQVGKQADGRSHKDTNVDESNVPVMKKVSACPEYRLLSDVKK